MDQCLSCPRHSIENS